MDQFHNSQEEEQAYLDNALDGISKQLYKEEGLLEERLDALITSGKEMWDESNHSVADFDKLVEMNQYLSQYTSDTTNYNITKKKIAQLKRLEKSPYFGRFDFKEEDYADAEKIYIGIGTLSDAKTSEIIIYDWRAPISGMFYSCELGKGDYKSPNGKIIGEIFLKRQYKIVDTELKYFFDSSITINDEILQEVLSHNASSKMKNIVETIQKEQDVIIRDTENELLIVQGVAGSGKTSIALHRIAFLLYEGLSYKLKRNNIIIISPNLAFSNYISSVLPELGEENVEQLTLEEVFAKFLPSRLRRETREEQLERLILTQGKKMSQREQRAIEFKGSTEFVEILNRFIKYYEKNDIKFKDIYYDGKIVVNGELIRDFFLNDKINMPLVKRLQRIESMIFNKVEPFQKDRQERILSVVDKCDNHPFDKQEYSRLLAMKEARRLKDYIQLFTIQDYVKMYGLLFENKQLFLKIAKGLKLPEDIDEILETTSNMFKKGYLAYEDCAPLLYLKIKLEGNEMFGEVRQTVIDEAQDYYPMNYHIFKLLFKDAKFTILGDFNQSVEKNGSNEIYDDIEKILKKKKRVKVTLNKGYRSSFEINAFNKGILGKTSEAIAFERHDEEPLIKKMDSIELMEETIIEDVQALRKQGFESIALICKTMEEAKGIFQRLRDRISCRVIDDIDGDYKSKLTIMPTYLAKGLELDGVLVYNASNVNYNTEFDKRLLYIACTRPLHRLYVYHAGDRSKYLLRS